MAEGADAAHALAVPGHITGVLRRRRRQQVLPYALVQRHDDIIPASLEWILGFQEINMDMLNDRPLPTP